MTTIITIQEALFKTINPNIITNINNDGHTLIADNISEEDFAQLTFVTNSPSFNGTKMSLFDIKVYLDNEVQPTMIYGLLEIVKQTMTYEESIAYSEGQSTYEPFINGFQVGTIGDIVNELSSLSVNTPYTYNKKKIYSLYIENDDPINLKKISNKLMSNSNNNDNNNDGNNNSSSNSSSDRDTVSVDLS
jgi:hypothetical protein